MTKSANKQKGRTATAGELTQLPWHQELQVATGTGDGEKARHRNHTEDLASTCWPWQMSQMPDANARSSHVLFWTYITHCHLHLCSIISTHYSPQVRTALFTCSHLVMCGFHCRYTVYLLSLSPKCSDLCTHFKVCGMCQAFLEHCRIHKSCQIVTWKIWTDIWMLPCFWQRTCIRRKQTDLQYGGKKTQRVKSSDTNWVLKSFERKKSKRRMNCCPRPEQTGGF